MLCDRFAVTKEHKHYESPVNPYSEVRRSLFLDGGIERLDGDYFCERKGTWIYGARAFRFILYELDFPFPPRRLKCENRIPTYEELKAELAAQQSAELSRKAELIAAEIEEYTADVICLERAFAAIDDPGFRLNGLPKPRTPREIAVTRLLELYLRGMGEDFFTDSLRRSLWPDIFDPRRWLEDEFRLRCEAAIHREYPPNATGEVGGGPDSG
jgi:hypothetical protein